jgi:hypothetical protein
MSRNTRKTKKDETIALVSRVYIGELPYIKYFLDYYIKIGIDKIYLIITNKTEAPLIMSYIKDYMYITEVVINETRTINMRIFNMDKINIKEDFTLFLDIDEFLDISPLKNIKDILKDEPGDKYNFNWIIKVNDGFSNNEKGYNKTSSKKPFKTMCRTALIDRWEGSHNFITKRETIPVKSKYRLIHHYGRTFNDILIKCIYGKGMLNKDKNTSLDEVLKDIRSDDVNDIPNRFKMLALVSRVPKTVNVKLESIYEYIDYDLENELLKIIDSTEKKRLLEKYEVFRERLDYKQIEVYYTKGMSKVNFKTIVV